MILRTWFLTFSVAVFLIGSICPAYSQTDAAESITAHELKTHLSFIASDELKGRNAPSLELKIAARYLATRAESFGLKSLMPNGLYLQLIDLPIVSYDEKRTQLSLSSDGSDRVFGFPDMFGIGRRSDEGSYTGNVVFLGYGISDPENEWDDYGTIDLTGKIVILLDVELPPGHVLNTTENRQRIRSRTIAPRQRGAAGVLTVINETRERDMALKGYTFDNIERGIFPERESSETDTDSDSSGSATEPRPMGSPYFTGELRHEASAAILGVTQRELKELFAQIERGEQVQTNEIPDKSLTISFVPKVRQGYTQNVAAVVEGSDPALKDEYVLLGAHYDHVGTQRGQIWNGADDDGSGTVALLEIAQAMALNPPRRSVIFVWHTGEEKGLQGSRYFTTNPPIPLEKVSAHVNIDMVGRNDPEQVYVIGAGRISTELNSIVQNVNESYIGMNLDYTYDAPDDPNQFYFRSDHYMYAQYGIPSTFFFTDVHEDYHQPSDTYDKIDFEKLARVARLGYGVAYNAANKEEMLKLNADPNVTLRGVYYPQPRGR